MIYLTQLLKFMVFGIIAGWYTYISSSLWVVFLAVIILFLIDEAQMHFVRKKTRMATLLSICTERIDALIKEERCKIQNQDL